MNNIIIHPTYFPSISHCVAMVQSDKIVFEMEDNFQKQTNRNRTYIYSPNGIQLLNIPVKHSNQLHQKTRDVQIENDFDWQKQHLKSLEAAYRSSPFFEYFEDDIRPIFEKKHTYLMDLNFENFEIISKCLRFKFEYTTTTEYFREVDKDVFLDFRFLANGKKDASQFESYPQVFNDKHGFLNNLSVLDLIFNEGKFALDYLKNQKLTPFNF
ncbi:WbqC family protein [Flavobacterium sp.]|uniref:WbqC family protein n=1 Tax=Flavobacterium sp. TaxID=239 RepID=UPI00286D3BEE|nr:WbqC family protein [Flavobacterium sp.]